MKYKTRMTFILTFLSILLGIKEARRLLAKNVPHCSFNFFGLPRSFKTIALPSIVKNILLPNAKYNCDIVVHHYKIDNEEKGRFNSGGKIYADAVYALEEVTKVIAANAGKIPPSVIIKGETKEEFNEKYGHLVHSYQTTKDSTTGNLKYFPWADLSYTKKQIENIVMQWNSIHTAWNLMEEYGHMHRLEYSRVAFFRLDAFYAVPVDIYKVDRDTFDYNNRYAVIPAFAKYPVNDRMIYGPNKAVKIWATERFERLEQYIATSDQKGYGMHPERYLSYEILPAITKETGYDVIENIDICFYRTRAADRVLINDCSDPNGGKVRGIEKINQVELVQELVNRVCRKVPFDKSGRFIELQCDDSSRRVSRRRLNSST